MPRITEDHALEARAREPRLRPGVRRLAAAAALAGALAATPSPALAVQHPDPSDVVAKSTPRNRVVVGVGPQAGGPSFLPLAGRPLQLRLYGRGPLVRAGRLRVRMLPGGVSCARGGGTAVPLAGGSTSGTYTSIAISARTISVRKPGARRFCVSSGGRLVGDQRIAFFGPQFGVAVDSTEKLFIQPREIRDGAAVAVWQSTAYSTFPFTITTSDDGCHPSEPRTDRMSVSSSGGLASYSSAQSITFDSGRCTSQARTFAFSAGGRSTTIRYGSDQALSPERPIAHSGACVPSAVARMATYDARRMIATQGCRVGRVISVRSPDSGGTYGTPQGAVYSATRNGEPVFLAPAGTTVDLLVNGRPKTGLTGANPQVIDLLRRYADQDAAGEQHRSGDAGPRLPGRPGVVLVRFFIPSETAAGGLLKGDGRSFSSDPAQPYRAALLWDTTNGRIDFRVTGSCRKGVLGFLYDSRAACKPALRVVGVERDEVFKRSDSRRSTNLVNVGGTVGNGLEARFSLLNSYTNSLPGPLGAWSVDETLTIGSAPTPSGFALRMVGNGYPAMEAYWYADTAGAVPLTIARRSIETPHVAAYKIPADRGGGDAALDRVSWATCETRPDGSATDCRDRRNGGRTWSTPNG